MKHLNICILIRGFYKNLKYLKVVQGHYPWRKAYYSCPTIIFDSNIFYSNYLRNNLTLAINEPHKNI